MKTKVNPHRPVFKPGKTQFNPIEMLWYDEMKMFYWMQGQQFFLDVVYIS